MLQKDIAIGGEYLTRVSGALVRVRVLRVDDRPDWLSGRAQTRYVVARVDTGKALDKHRHASALHKPVLDPFEAETIRAFRTGVLPKPDAEARLLSYYFVRTINGATP